MEPRPLLSSAIFTGMLAAAVRLLLGRRHLRIEQKNSEVDNNIKLLRNAFDISQQLQESLKHDIERLTKQNTDMDGLLSLLMERNTKLMEENAQLRETNGTE